jgi:hypothetical protein
MTNWLISAFDYTGNASLPYRQAGWDVSQIDRQHGLDFFDFDYRKELNDRSAYGLYPNVGIIAMIPCTDYAVSGARHFARKDADGTTEESQKLVEAVREMIFFFKDAGLLKFWQVENPRTRLHTLNPWLNPIRQKFNPSDFAGYDPVPDNSRYNKDTWLFGDFNLMTPKPLPPLQKEYPGWSNFGGKSLKTKNARSVSPLGYCYAFFEANH